MARPTPANLRAQTEYKKARKNALAKIRRLKKKGIRTGSIEPDLVSPNPSDTWGLKRATKELKQFTSRSNAWVAGREGSPIRKSTETEYRRLAKQAESINERWWKIYGREEPKHTIWMPRYLMASGGLFGRRMRSWIAPTRGFTQKELEARIDRLKEMLSPDYEKTVIKNLRNNLFAAVDQFDSELANKLKALKDKQILALTEFTDIMSVIAMYYRGLRYQEGVPGEETFYDSFEESEELEPLEYLRQHIEHVIEKSPKLERDLAKGDKEWKQFRATITKDTGNVKGKVSKRRK